MRILFVSGSVPPEYCGVGHYTNNLAKALRERGVNVDILSTPNWSVRNAGSKIKEINRRKPDIVHVQYPTIGYGHGLGPHIIGLAKRSVVTVHEVTQAHVLRRLSLFLFSLRSHLIFTNEYELKYSCLYAPWIRNKACILPIGSNIPVALPQRREKQVVYFGLIAPNKGIENFIQGARIAAEKGINIRFVIMGARVPGKDSYLKELQEQTKTLSVEWKIDLPDKLVANELQRSFLAYLPFPDGASERRGSLLAVLANGVPAVTTHGTFTSNDLSNVTVEAKNPLNAVAVIEDLLGKKEMWSKLSKRGQDYAERFSWQSIASEHIKLYETIVE